MFATTERQTTGLRLRVPLVATLVILGAAIATTPAVSANAIGGERAWDLITHAAAGHPVLLFENTGHWLAFAGLFTTGAAGLALLRSPPASTADGP